MTCTECRDMIDNKEIEDMTTSERVAIFRHLQKCDACDKFTQDGPQLTAEQMKTAADLALSDVVRLKTDPEMGHLQKRG